MKTVATKNSEYLWPLVGLSFAIHLGIFGVVYLDILDSQPRVTESLMTAKLVRLGKKRDENLLPRKAQEAPEGKATEAPKQELPPPQVKQPEPKPQIVAQAPKSDRKPTPVKAKARESASSHLDKLVRSMEIGGNEHGSVLGSELNGPLEQGYQDEVAQILRESFELPSILSDAERRNLEVVVHLRIDASGRLIAAKVIHASVRQLFDDSVIEGAKSVSNFGAPPLPLRKKFAKEGLYIKFCPVSCRKGA